MSGSRFRFCFLPRSQTPTSVAVVDPGPDACPVPGTCLGNRITNDVTVGAFTLNGTYVYDFTVTDDAGCQYNRPVTITVTGCSVSLPVGLTSFDAEYKNNEVLVTWATESEQNNDRFDIYRSADGENWSYVGTKKGAGNSSSLISYSLPDKDYLGGVSYYKLAQVDMNGERKESYVISITIANANGKRLVAYPNPTKNELRVIMDRGFSGDIKLLDSRGVEIALSRSPEKISDEEYLFDLSELKTGIYFLQSNGGLVKVVKL